MLMDKGSQLRVSSCNYSQTWDAAPPGGNDAMLRWMERYADALQEQFSCALVTQDLSSLGICLFPTKPPWQVCTVSHALMLRILAICINKTHKLWYSCLMKGSLIQCYSSRLWA